MAEAVVGIESSIEELIGVLEGGSSQRAVISVVGTGGLGKTTLAREVYDRVKRSFDCYAWIEASQTYNKVELLWSLMKKLYLANEEYVHDGNDPMDESTLIEELRDYLQGKRYLVVFDGVSNQNLWVDVKDALPEESEKSGIIITTRDIRVAKFCESKSSCVHIHQLQHLPGEKAWELFCKKAFHSEPQKDCPAYLNELTHKIVERCQGLPLAIIVMAGLLSTKNKNVDEWRKLHAQLETGEPLTGIMKILSLSYNDLPNHLKFCLLYFGLFPEDYFVRSTRLVRRWIAEGFVKPTEDKTLEVVAEDYLAELINRSLVQVTHVDFAGKARSFRIHDLLREIILAKMEDLSFCQLLSGKNSNFTGSAQRISLANGSHEVINRSSPNLSQVQSIFIFDNDKMPSDIVSTIATKFKLLKVLDLEDAPNVDHLPRDIGNLIHLRSLSLRGTQVKLLPESIGKLENLESLDLKRTEVYELPVEINRLHKLQYLVAYLVVNDREFYIRRGVKTGEGLGNLTELQKLFYVEANVEGVNLFEELSKLTNLRRLGLGQLRSEDGKALCECIQKMNHLESLDICSTTEDETIDLESMSSPPQSLQRVYLVGRLNKLPKWIPELQTLVRVRFFWSKLEEDPLKALQHLQNLLELGFYRDGYHGQKLHFEEGAFPKLKVLVIRNLSRLNSLVIEEGALSSLEDLEIGPCPQLKDSHSGFQHLRSLKHIAFYEIPTKFLMSFNLQSLENVPDFELFPRIDGRLIRIQLERVKEILRYVQEHDDIDWESLDFGEILSNWFEPVIRGVGSFPPPEFV